MQNLLCFFSRWGKALPLEKKPNLKDAKKLGAHLGYAKRSPLRVSQKAFLTCVQVHALWPHGLNPSDLFHHPPFNLIPIMRILLILLTGLLASGSLLAQGGTDAQIAAAVMAAPEDMRAEATVMGYDAQGELIMLREGSNGLICLADDPGKKGFQCACYHADLEPFMARGRALRAEGKTFQEVFEIREAEAKAGTLTMPDHPSTLHILSGPEGRYDAAQDTVVDAYYRYVVYIPWATAASTGLPTAPIVPGGPWIMDPGTHRAHIMVTPVRPEK
jgi:hypothetical protein